MDIAADKSADKAADFEEISWKIINSYFSINKKKREFSRAFLAHLLL
jgi:hypothetical protein